MDEMNVEFAYVVYKNEDGQLVVTDDAQTIVVKNQQGDDVLLSPERRCSGSDYSQTAQEIKDDMLAQSIVSGMLSAQMQLAQQMSQQQQTRDIMSKLNKTDGGLVVP